MCLFICSCVYLFTCSCVYLFTCSSVYLFTCPCVQLGRLPVHYAAEKDHTQTVALLMSYMGFPFIQDPPVDKVWTYLSPNSYTPPPISPPQSPLLNLTLHLALAFTRPSTSFYICTVLTLLLFLSVYLLTVDLMTILRDFFSPYRMG